MRLPLVLLASVALLASSASAARIAKSPRTSVMDNAQLKREIKKRQATTADLKRRNKQRGSKRKREDPSALPPTCLVGANVLDNGDFETGQTSPFEVLSSSTANLVGVFSDTGYGGASGTASKGLLFVSGSENGGSVRVSQSVTLCGAFAYQYSFDLGLRIETTETTPLCVATVSLTTTTGDGESTTQSLYTGRPCSSTFQQSLDYCPDNNGPSGYSYRTHTGQVSAFAGTTDAVFALDWSCPAESQTTNVADNFVLQRAEDVVN